MRIGIDARMYGSAVTGIGIYTKNLIDNLLKIDQQNEYVIFLLPENFKKFKIQSAKVKKVEVNIPWYSWSEQIKLPSRLLSEKLDLMHFPHFNVPILYPKKYVVTIHDITPKFFPGSRVRKSRVRKLGYWTVFQLGIKKAKKIISVSHHTKKHLVENFKLNSKKIEVIYPGLNINLQPVLNYDIINQLKAKYKITKSFIFYVGVWRDHKNLPGLIRAFDILRRNYKLDIQLVLGGQEDPDYPEIRQTWQNLKLEKDIIRPGFIPERDLPFFYSQAEVFVLPSFNEGFGLVALESIACGTPVIASKTTSIPEVLQNAALYFDPNNYEEMASVIYKVLTNKEIAKSLIKTGQEKIKKYSWENLAKQTLNIYEKVAKK